MSDDHGKRWPTEPVTATYVEPFAARSTEELLTELVRRNRIRPPECFEGEDVYRWLLAERDWLLGPVSLAQHRIRIAEGTFEHDAVQLACDQGCPPTTDR